MNPLLMTDGYKLHHHKMYPENTEIVFSTFVPRNSKYYKGIEKDNVVSFGQQGVLHFLNNLFTKYFFEIPKTHIDSFLNNTKKFLDGYTGFDYDITHFRELYDLGYLPIEVRSIEEGTIVPIGYPLLTIHNTHPKFYWLTNFLETFISSNLWQSITSATIARDYKTILDKYAKETSESTTEFQAHDFSMRGMSSVVSVIYSGLGHLTSFKGSDSLTAVEYAEHFYNQKKDVAYSVPASEHSVMCAGGKESEIETFRRLLKTYPKGVLSIVSDTWDLWKVCTKYLPQLKEEILARDGKLVIRPDSGDPVNIVCGEFLDDNGWDGICPNQKEYLVKSRKDLPKERGVVQLLWDIFGGTVNSKGYKELDPHIGVIYGDSITLDRAEEICYKLKEKGFASTNVTLGIGSYTYQYNTRDSFSLAMKATYAKVNGEERNLVKDPITDSNKKSLKGLVAIINNKLIQETTWDIVNSTENQLKVIYRDGKFYQETNLNQIRKNVNESIRK